MTLAIFCSENDFLCFRQFSPLASHSNSVRLHEMLKGETGFVNGRTLVICNFMDATSFSLTTLVPANVRSARW